MLDKWHSVMLISIHALREEGDPEGADTMTAFDKFLSTPSARRATDPIPPPRKHPGDFYPRPPRGGRPIKPEAE